MLNHRSRVRENKDVKTYLGSFQLTQVIFFLKHPLRRDACVSVGLAWAQSWRWLLCHRSVFLPHSSSLHTEIVHSQNTTRAQQHVSVTGAKAEGWEDGAASSWALSIPTFSPPHIQLRGQCGEGFAPHIFHIAERQFTGSKCFNEAYL